MLQTDPDINVDRLNSAQRSAYNTIISSVHENKGTTFFLNGGAGTGKTFLYNTELFRETKLIIWDEVPMQHRY